MAEKVDIHTKTNDPRFEEARKHFKAAREAMHKSLKELLPKNYTENSRAAHKEFLLAMRSLLDAALERLEKQ
jgi:hypothetical protein